MRCLGGAYADRFNHSEIDMQYVTSDNVTTVLGADWALAGNETLAILMANAWLNQYRLPIYTDVVPIEIITAGAYIAQEFIAGNMYQSSTEGVVTSKTVKVGEVSTSKTFSSNDVSQLLTVGEQIANTLIAPYLLGMVVVVPLGRF